MVKVEWNTLLEPEQREYLGRLETGQAIVKLQGRWLKPFLVRMPLLPIKKGAVTDEEIRTKNGSYSPASNLYSLPERFREVLLLLPGHDKREEKETGITSDEGEFLRDVVQHPLSAVVERNRKLVFTARRGNKTKESLLEKGLIRVVDLSTKAGRVKILRLTEKGKELAEKLGYRYRDLPKNASVAHEYWKEQVAEMYRRAGYKVNEEVPIKDGSVDVVASDGKELIAIEIETGRSDAVGNIRKCLQAGFDAVVVGLVDPELKERIEGLLGPDGAQQVDFLCVARS